MRIRFRQKFFCCLVICALGTQKFFKGHKEGRSLTRRAHLLCYEINVLARLSDQKKAAPERLPRVPIHANSLAVLFAELFELFLKKADSIQALFGLFVVWLNFQDFLKEERGAFEVFFI